jgi:hypothetical protein
LEIDLVGIKILRYYPNTEGNYTFWPCCGSGSGSTPKCHRSATLLSGSKEISNAALHSTGSQYNLMLLLMYRALLGNTTLLNYLRAKGEIGDEQITQLKQLLPGAVPRQPSPPPPQFTIPGLGGPPPAFSPLPQVSCCQPSFFP